MSDTSASGTTISVSTSPINALYQAEMYMHVLTPAERAIARSNLYADAAMAWADVGRFITAEVCAELADAYATIAGMMAVASSIDSSVHIPHELPPLLAAALMPKAPLAARVAPESGASV